MSTKKTKKVTSNPNVANACTPNYLESGVGNAVKSMPSRKSFSVREAENGFVIQNEDSNTYQYKTYIAKSTKETSKIISKLLK